MKKLLIIVTALAAGMFGLNADHHEGKGKGPHGPMMHGKMMEMMDTDKDGKISKQEWQAHHDKMFADMDADKDGYVTPDEMKAMHKMMMEKHGKMKDEGKEKRPKKKKKKDDDE